VTSQTDYILQRHGLCYTLLKEKVLFPSQTGPQVTMISVSAALSQTSAYTNRPQTQGHVGQCISVPVYSPTSANTHCAQPLNDVRLNTTKQNNSHYK